MNLSLMFEIGRIHDYRIITKGKVNFEISLLLFRSDLLYIIKVLRHIFVFDIITSKIVEKQLFFVPLIISYI
jgi:hypothetical protein